MNSDMQNLLRQILLDSSGSSDIFDRLAAEYRTKGASEQHDLFLACAVELATAQMVISALKKTAVTAD